MYFHVLAWIEKKTFLNLPQTHTDGHRQVFFSSDDTLLASYVQHSVIHSGTNIQRNATLLSEENIHDFQSIIHLVYSR